MQAGCLRYLWYPLRRRERVTVTHLVSLLCVSPALLFSP